MGYIVLGPQLDTLRALTGDKEVDSVELLWLPGRIEVTVWTTHTHDTYSINEDGEYTHYA